MAYRDNKKYNHEHAANEFALGSFNITKPVGKKEVGSGFSAPNLITDMQLVDYFLYMICRYGDRKIFPVSSEAVFMNPALEPRNKNYHSPDSASVLGDRILIFQQNLKDSGRPIYVDGRCDPARETFSSIAKTAYTIHYANFHYAKTIKSWKGRADWQNYLLMDPLLPNQVRFELLSSSAVPV